MSTQQTDADHMHTLDWYQQQIAQRCPDLIITQISMNQDGQYNDVLMVNDDLVFRFAKVPAAQATLQREIEILERIGPYLPLPLPQPLALSHEQDQAVTMMGYPRLPGSPLWYVDWAALSVATQTQIGRQLGGFLHALHHIPITALPEAMQEPWDLAAPWVNLYQRIQQRLFAYMRPDAQTAVARHFTEVLESRQRDAITPCLIHGDFGTGNILYDATHGSITGILDFGGAGLGDPATDVAALTGYGIEMRTACASVYPEILEMQGRSAFYQGTFALQEALFGIENQDREAFESGIAAYR